MSYFGRLWTRLCDLWTDLIDDSLWQNLSNGNDWNSFGFSSADSYWTNIVSAMSLSLCLLGTSHLILGIY